MSFLIAIGSPALAAYSLHITHLNRCWIAGTFLDVEYPNSKRIPTVLAAFHHIPIKMEYSPPFLHSLIVLPKNDEFWSRLAAANKTRRWSIPLVMSYTLTIFSLVLTIVDAAVTQRGSTGYGIAATWTFLFPLTIGWLHTGYEPEPSHLRKSLASANRAAWIATNQRDCPVKMTMPKAIEFAGTDDVDLARKDELRPVPVFNYSRAFTTPANAEVFLRLMKNASANAKRTISVSGSTSEGTLSAWVESEGDEIPSEDRVGTAAEVVEYCTRVLQPSKEDLGFATPLETQSLESTKITNRLLDDGLVTPSRWAPGVWKRVVISSILALGLQWATAGAAVFIHYIPPPVGLGCRAFSFLMYGVMGTLSFFLFLASSILAHMSRPLHRQVPTRSWSRTCQNAGAIICRWLGKCVAIASGIGILVVCFFHVAGVLDNCYCRSTTLNMGRGPVTLYSMRQISDPRVLSLWFIGLAVPFVASIVFGFSMYMTLPPRRYE